MTTLARLVPLFAALLAAALTPALAHAQDGTGENIKAVKNIPYPNLQFPNQKNNGTDLEFATITVAGPGAKSGKPADVPSGNPPASAPPSQSKASPTAVAKARSRSTAASRAAKRASKRCTSARKAAKKAKSRSAKRNANRRAKQLCASARRAKTRAARLKRTVTAIERAGLKDAKPEQPGIQRTFAFAGSYGDGLQVIDVTDPEKSQLVATWDCGVSQGDVQVFQRADLGGRWFVTYTMDNSYPFAKDSTCAKEVEALGFKPQESESPGLTPAHAKTPGVGTYIAEVTDPYAPKAISFVPIVQASHNQTVHPSGKYLYNSNSDLINSVTPAVEIFDISDITKPRFVKEVGLKTFPGLGTESHDIMFSNDGKRGYVAALSHGEILDTSDPANPKSISTTVDPTINVWHQAGEITVKDKTLGQERKFMIAEDEVAGATGTGQCPNGAVHVYDITGPLENAPVKVGTWNIDDTGLTTDQVDGTCTAHVFQLHEKQQLMTIAYYNGGVRVVDLSGLVGVALGKQGVAGMRELGSYRFKNSDTWSAKAYQADRKGFYIFGNDLKRGFDIYKYEPSAPTSPGIWRSPEEQMRAMQYYRASGGKLELAAVCLLNLGESAGVKEAAARAGFGLAR